jgi:hypothetical protein
MVYKIYIDLIWILYSDYLHIPSFKRIIGNTIKSKGKCIFR